MYCDPKNIFQHKSFIQLLRARSSTGIKKYQYLSTLVAFATNNSRQQWHRTLAVPPDSTNIELDHLPSWVLEYPFPLKKAAISCRIQEIWVHTSIRVIIRLLIQTSRYHSAYTALNMMTWNIVMVAWGLIHILTCAPQVPDRPSTQCN